MTEFSFAGVKSRKLTSVQELFHCIIWGTPGCGKSVLAYTAPRPIYCIQWDKGGSASIKTSDEIEILDLSSEPDAITDRFKVENNKDLRALEEHIRDSKVSSIIWDSATTHGEKAFGRSMKVGPAFAKGKEQVSFESPGFTGYGIKNMLVTQAIRNIHAIAVRCRCHLIVIAHEGSPTTDEKGNMLHHTMTLGSSLSFKIPADFSEVWHMQDINGKRLITLRPKGYFKPMKTRMFDASTQSTITWNYDQKTEKGDTITKWYEDWVSNGFNKLSVKG